MAKFDQNDDGVVVIIGSGAAGGTLANELCQKGVNVVLLEAGGVQTSASFLRVTCMRYLQRRIDSFAGLAAPAAGSADAERRAGSRVLPLAARG
jgi:choline dehydrogenase-like flavoprotein